MTDHEDRRPDAIRAAGSPDPGDPDGPLDPAVDPVAAASAAELVHVRPVAGQDVVKG